MRTPEKDAGEVFIGCIGWLAVLVFGPPYAVLLYGWALTKLWLWFVVPTFGLAPLSLAMACGLDALVTLMRGTPLYLDDFARETKRSEGEKTALGVFRQTMFVLLTLGVGYVVHRWFV